ncbi:MAG TPA: hypothetical protein VE975_06960 [Actinomycetota bacterium]|jgi:hypothetical protein|nr:hypothetical protein [Actinomycetota bacterium]
MDEETTTGQCTPGPAEEDDPKVGVHLILADGSEEDPPADSQLGRRMNYLARRLFGD